VARLAPPAQRPLLSPRPREKELRRHDSGRRESFLAGKEERAHLHRKSSSSVKYTCRCRTAAEHRRGLMSFPEEGEGRLDRRRRRARTMKPAPPSRPQRKATMNTSA